MLLVALQTAAALLLGAMIVKEACDLTILI